MVLIEKFWDDVRAGPQPGKGLGKLRKSITLIQPHARELHSGKAESPSLASEGGEGEGPNKNYQRSLSMTGSGSGSPITPGTPMTPNSRSPTTNVWRSVFDPGSNIATKRIGAEVFDKPSHPNAPTVYDWLYSGNTRSKHQ